MNVPVHSKLHESTRKRLWVLPLGLYPLRITIYLKEKGISDEFEIIPVQVGANGQSPSPGKPPGTLPILEVARPNSEEKGGRYIFQSTAILEYLEDTYQQSADHLIENLPDMRGKNAELRARGRECMDLLNEAVSFFTFYCQNSSALYSFKGDQKEDAAKKALDRMHSTLSQLESLADTEGPFLSHAGDHPMMVDCVAIATIRFAKSLYGVDLAEKHPVLRRVADAFMGRQSIDVDEEWPEEIQRLGRQMTVY